MNKYGVSAANRSALQLVVHGLHDLLSSLLRGFDTVSGYFAVCEKVRQLLVDGRWFPPGSPVSATNKTVRDIA